MAGPRELIDHVVASVTGASEAQAAGARARLGARGQLGGIEALAARLCAARHAPRPRAERKTILLCAADHGIADAGIDWGEQSPTIIAARHIAAGEAAVNHAARTAGAQLLIADCGIRGAAGLDLGPGVIGARIADGSADFTRGAAMTPPECARAVQTGIALVISLADGGLDVLALGQVSCAAEPASAALVCALAGASPDALDEADGAVVAAGLAANRPRAHAPLEALAAVGGLELAVMTGAILAAASIGVPVVLDDHATSAAALVAARLAPASAGYVIASHRGRSPIHHAALDALGLHALFDLGLAHGEGTGAALALPMIDAAARMLDHMS